MEYYTHKLSNGIRIIHKENSSMVAHLGVIINVGSRDEKEKEHGLAHFIEHLLFKGTQKRKAFHVINRLENVGGELNAFTSKEYTCLHSSFLKEDYPRSIELFHDIIFHSSFPVKEIEKEKEVVLDEINSYKDNPAELIFDDFEEYLFNHQPIGRNILGEKKYIRRFNQAIIKDFLNRNYHPGEIVISSIGNISFKRLVKLIEKYFGTQTKGLKINGREKIEPYTPFHKTISKRTHQAHCMLGNIAYNVQDERKSRLQLLNNILGGPNLNSRLNIALREKSGYSYNVESHYVPYTDTGTFMIYFSAGKKNIDKSFQIIYKEIKKLRDKKLGTLQLSKAKRQILGQIAIAAENKEYYMISMGKNYLLYDKIFSIEEIKNKFDAITADDLIETANEILQPDQLSTLIYGQ